MTTGELALAAPSAGTLALQAGQQDWTPVQRAALAQIGVDSAPAADQAVFLHVSQRTGLDPFSRQIYMICRAGKWTIQTGIDGFRIIAERHPQYAGQDEPQWCGEDGVWKDVWTEKKPPTAARVGVYRHDWKRPVYGTVHFAEFAATGSGGNLTPMWRDKSAHMIGKVAEAHGLRKAFPQDLSGMYTDDEMAHVDNPPGRVVVDQAPAPSVAELTGSPAPAAAGGQVDPARMRQLFALIRDAEVEDRTKFASVQLGRNIGSFGELTADDVAALITELQERVAEASAAESSS